MDCNAHNPQWASVTNGVFLCITCVGIHRGFGAHISFVRSVTMDSWSPVQVAQMKYGGNKRLRKFWKYQNLGSSLTIEQKYDNTDMEKYRFQLLKEATKAIQEEVESVEDKVPTHGDQNLNFDPTLVVSPNRTPNRLNNAQRNCESSKDDHALDITKWAVSVAVKSGEKIINYNIPIVKNVSANCKELVSKTKTAVSQLGEKVSEASSKIKEHLQESNINKTGQSPQRFLTAPNASPWKNQAKKSVKHSRVCTTQGLCPEETMASSNKKSISQHKASEDDSFDEDSDCKPLVSPKNKETTIKNSPQGNPKRDLLKLESTDNTIANKHEKSKTEILKATEKPVNAATEPVFKPVLQSLYISEQSDDDAETMMLCNSKEKKRTEEKDFLN
ncbi:ADP-ribosylation factor GTPase-activating protein 3 [Reticulomyxa filosa]|uniref:ADP-ribosylation factor GTPase-activating protein 3 n=1 Tax=Reticulomyxa filosa TaxID=46433 RepID=X6LUC3_RETFI|nr:ADP-ribosylation factor GTPase-activating protein 3 [Reticulomyxa filosa]|eukprot:ETO04320.1 ADP-ribosylation factor GTPase-activating protein 3 [Reticulomyxa filosa]